MKRLTVVLSSVVGAISLAAACSVETGSGVDGGGGPDAIADTSVADMTAKDMTVSDQGADAQDATDGTITDAQDGGSDASDASSDANDASDAKDASDASDASDSGIQDSGTDSSDGGFLLNGCSDSDFVDKTQGNQSNRTVDWDLNQNFPYCFTISQGQSFVWNTTINLTFANHPLEPAGGDQNNPISVTNSGTTVTFQFSNTGNFGFDCQFHPGIMRGVIRVK